MKRLLTIISVFALLLTACEGPQGPPGFDGQDGSIIASSAFEIVLDFTEENDYSFVEPYGFEVLETDVTLVYVQEGQINGEDAWRLLPQLFFLPNGNEVEYNFDFTQTNVRFFLDTADFSLLTSDFTNNQLFRVVVVPADNVGRVDYSDINTVMERFNITSFPRR